MGTEITLLGLPLIAAQTLNATSLQMGILEALGLLSWFAFGIFAGVWADRISRRALLIFADVGRALLISVVPVAFVLGWLSFPLLYAVTLLIGSLTVCADVAAPAFVSDIVARDQLVTANSRLQLSRSLAQTIGPGLAGVLLQLLTAPIALILDSASYLISVFFLYWTKGTKHEYKSLQVNTWREIREGFNALFGNSVLRALAVSSAHFSFFMGIFTAINVLFIFRTFQPSAATLGMVFALAGIGALLGAVSVGRLIAKYGLGKMTTASLLLIGAGCLSISVSGNLLKTSGALLLLIAGESLISFGASIFSILAVSLRQSMVSQSLQGRINATQRTIVMGAMAIGSLVGGGMGDVIGLQLTIGIAGVGIMLAVFWVLISQRKHIQQWKAPTLVE